MQKKPLISRRTGKLLGFTSAGVRKPESTVTIARPIADMAITMMCLVYKKKFEGQTFQLDTGIFTINSITKDGVEVRHNDKDVMCSYADITEMCSFDRRQREGNVCTKAIAGWLCAWAGNNTV